ncbi:MAG: hypothetical protein JNK05_41990 [Myxococcales bacterium]|nr:hypothetical protein [Myxococcales bacterium]
MISRHLALVLSIFAATSLTHCAQGSCNFNISDRDGNQFPTCIELVATSTAISTTVLKDYCAMQSGTYAASTACDGNTDVGRCQLPTRETRDSEGNAISYYYRYRFYRPLTVEQARTACSSVGGTFSEVTR